MVSVYIVGFHEFRDRKMFHETTDSAYLITYSQLLILFSALTLDMNIPGSPVPKGIQE